MKDLIAKLRDTQDITFISTAARMEAANLLERIYSQPVELPEPSYFGLSKDHLWMSITKLTYDHMLPEYRMTSYTADQLTKAVQEATARALEAAAKEAWNHEPDENGPIETAIRNLIGGVK